MTGIMRGVLWWLAIAVLCSPTLIAAAQDAAGVELQAAIRAETVDGDLKEAIRLYEQLATRADSVTAARALMRMGRCYEKLGANSAAINAYTRLVGRFANTEAAGEARKRLALISATRESSPPARGWYNGEWQSGIPGLANWFRSYFEYARVYDSFIVPETGWIVAAVFSCSRMEFDHVTEASWEIRSRMAPGSMGRLIASGLVKATAVPENGPFPQDPMIGYRVQVDGLHVALSPGRYWLSVAPVLPPGEEKSYISATRGKNSVGVSMDRGPSYFVKSGPDVDSPIPVEQVAARGQLGVAERFSQGVLILLGSKKEKTQ